MRKLYKLLTATTLALSLVGCGGNENETTSNTPKDDLDQELNLCLASEPASLDPALNSAADGGTMLNHLFAGLAKWSKGADGNFSIVADCAKDLPDGVTNDDGTVTYTYTLKDDLKWSDGQPLTAHDFIFAWNRAASPKLAADYSYIFEVVDGYDDMWETEADGETFKNPDATLNAKAIDDHTIEVTTKTYLPYWNELLAFPTFMPVRKDVVDNEAWATDPSTYVGNGPFIMADWQHNSLITLKKNDNYHAPDIVTMPVINFYLSDDANNMLTNFQNGSWQYIDSVPTNEIAALKANNPDEFKVVGQVGTYYVNWNVNERLLPDSEYADPKAAALKEQEIRKAISLLLDRNYIVENVAQGGQVPAASFVPMGMSDIKGGEFYEHAGTDKGYFKVDEDAIEDNFNMALDILKKHYDFDDASGKITNFPSLTYLYNTSEGHKAIAEYIQGALAGVGIDMQLQNQEWNTFLQTRKSGDYGVARNGWLADYNDPICFLDLWVTNSGNNDIQFGKGAHKDLAIYNLDLTDLGIDVKVENGTWAQTYDVLIDQIKTCSDEDTRYAMMHRAEDLLMSTGCVVPVYFYTDLYMISPNLKGFFSNPLGFKYFMSTTLE